MSCPFRDLFYCGHNKRNLFHGERQSAYFATILPGKARLSVHGRPPVGAKTALGFDVSRSSYPVPFTLVEVPSFRFLFYTYLLAGAQFEQIIDLPSPFPFCRWCL